MPETGAVCGSSSPFAVLAIAFAGLAWLATLMAAISVAAGPSRLRQTALRYSFAVSIPHMTLAGMTIHRISQNFRLNLQRTPEEAVVFYRLDQMAIWNLYLCLGMVTVVVFLTYVYAFHYRR